ncbi:hypothetical protein [Terrabacter sp. 2RAF25]|uniref:hypothetical protein n=1 Tax=Terrabacter sp. 2RAF25 TaxID=3232998 RepID=UPI003F97D313
MDNVVSFGSEAHRRPARARRWPVLPLAAAGWWVVGALPWIVDGLGARSPRNWPFDVATGSATDGYITLLPFTTARLGLLLTITLVGGAAAALAVRWVSPRPESRRSSSAVAALAGLGAVAAAAYSTLQSAGATRQLGSDFDRDDRVLVGVLAVAVAGTVAGLAIGLVLVLGRPVLRALAAAPLAVALGSWASAVVIALLGLERGRPLLIWTPTLTAVAVGLTLAAVGVRSLWRVVVWPLVVLLVAVCTAGQTAFSYLASYLRPRSGLPSGLRDHVEASRDVFLRAIQPEFQAWGAYAVAVAVGLVGAGVLWLRADPRRRSAGDQQRPAAASAAAADERVDATRR